MRIALVLGGGGVVGIAWEVGVLAGLRDACGFDPAAASVIVGTSAGSVIGSRLRLGHALDDLVAEQRTSDTLTEAATQSQGRDVQALMEIFQLWASAGGMGGPSERSERAPHPEGRMTEELAARVGALAVKAPTAAEETWIGTFRTTLGNHWPDGDLRVTAVSCDTGKRSVWTRASGVDLPFAVASSCAVPGLFPPVTIGAERFMDGGVWSGSNADAIGAGEADVAIFVGPFVGDQGVLRVSSAMLQDERDTLAGRGVALQEVVPGERFRSTIGMNLMDPALRVEGLELGLEDGKLAGGRVGAALS